MTGTTSHPLVRVALIAGSWMILAASEPTPQARGSAVAVAVQVPAPDPAPLFVSRHANPAGAFMPQQFGAIAR